MVRKFKPNKMTTVMFFAQNMWITLCVALPMMCWLQGAYDYMVMGLIFLTMIPLNVIFFSALNLFTHPFTPYHVILEDESFSREGTQVWYHEVTKIVFDPGEVSKHRSWEPCCLDFYAGDRMLLSITHPSLIMTFFVIRRCKHAKLRFARIKDTLLLLAVGIAIGVAIGLCGKFGGT